MKRILLFLAVAFIFGSVMPMMAQQRKVAPQRRATTTSAVPVIQRDHMEFLGLKMGGDVKAFEKALRQKGFADGWGFSNDPSQTFLRGNVYGMLSEICITAENNRVKTVSIVNMVNTQAAATNRINRLKKEMIALYGGKWTNNNGTPTLKLPYGEVTYSSGPFDSGDYELGMYITDNGKETNAPASQEEPQSQDTKNSYANGRKQIETKERVTEPKQPDSSLEDFPFLDELVHLKDFKKIREKLSSAGWNPTEPKDNYVGEFFLGTTFSGVSPVTKNHITVTKKSRKKTDIMLHLKQISFEKVKAEAAKINYEYDEETTKMYATNRKDSKDYYFKSPDGFQIFFMVLEVGPSVTFSPQ